MRLDKAISKFYNVSRSQSRKLILKGSVKINEKNIRDISFEVSPKDFISVNQKKIEYFDYIYIILNKPAGYICSRNRNEGRIIFDLINTNFSNELSACGRLDKDTEGLLILSNDGDFIHNIISPKKDIDKEYFVKLKYRIDTSINNLVQGVFISDDEFVAAKRIDILDEFSLRITISEGKYHQVKRMFKNVNNEVLYLKRIRIGYYNLPKNLKPGEWLKYDREQIYRKVLKIDAP